MQTRKFSVLEPEARPQPREAAARSVGAADLLHGRRQVHRATGILDITFSELVFGVVLFQIPWESLMAVTHHKCPKQFRKYPTQTGAHSRDQMEGSTDLTLASAERDAHIGRTFNLWASGCRSTPRYHTPPVVLSIPDLMARFNTESTRAWGQLSWSQTELMRVARRTLFELRVDALTRRKRS